MGPCDTRELDALAASLATAPPSAGPYDALDPERLSHAGLIHALIACDRAEGRIAATRLRLLAAVQTRRPGGDLDATVPEVAAATAQPSQATDRRLEQAERLVRVFPHTVDAMERGNARLEQAQALDERTHEALDQATCRLVEAQVLPGMRGQTLSQTKRAISRAVHRADPTAADRLHRREKRQRRVEVRDQDHGMGSLRAYTTATRATAMHQKLTDDAKTYKKQHPDDPRSLDELRADLHDALILGHTTDPGDVTADACTAGTDPEILVLVSAEILAGLSNQPAQIRGGATLTAQEARRIAYATNAHWRFVFLDSNGTPRDISVDRYSPRTAVKRLLCLIYPTCAFPGCTVDSRDCDIDHRLAYAKGGRTVLDNLIPLCRRHHRLKGHNKFTIHLDDNQLIFTMRSGQVYVTEPTRYPIRT